MDEKVSIVVPVYNCELYLEECINSLIKQTYRNLEIIFVDDGSTDASLSILEQYRHVDNRIAILTQSNRHAGVARNLGMSVATGDYIMFLDSDDTFSKNMVGKLLKKALKHNTDVIVFGNNICEKGKVIGWRKPDYNRDCIVNSLDIKDRLFQIDSGVPWNKFMKRDFVVKTNLKYQDTKNTNDIYFNKMLLTTADRILFTYDRFVNYRVFNSNSLQGKISKNPDDFAKALNAIHDELIHRNTYELFEYSYEKYAVDFCMYSINRTSNFEAFQNVVHAVMKILTRIGESKVTSYLSSELEKKVAVDICRGEVSQAAYDLNLLNKAIYTRKGKADFNIGFLNIRIKRRIS